MFLMLTGNKMDYCHHAFIRILVCFSICLFLNACGSSNSTEIEDTRPTIADFLNSNSEEHFVLTNEQSEEIVETANRVSFAFAKHSIQQNDANAAVVTWPILSSLPYLFAASQDDTYLELQTGFEDFGSIESLIGFSLLARTITNDTITLSNHIWWQHDSRYETDFLNAVDSTLKPQHFTHDFSAGNPVPAGFEEAISAAFKDNYESIASIDSESRAIVLNQLDVTAAFDANFQLSEFDGVFENGEDDYVRVPMLRVQGDISTYESDKFIAYKLPVADGKLSLVTIHPKEDMYDYTLENIDTVMQYVAGAWTLQETSMVAPVLLLETTSPGLDWFNSLNVESIYSESLADLRNMDRLGGHYINNQTYQSRLSISASGIGLSAITSNTVRFSEKNNFYRPETDLAYINAPEFDFPDFSSGLDLFYSDFINEIPIPESCIDIVPDLQNSILVITDEQNGLILSIATLNSMQGQTVEKECTPLFFGEMWERMPVNFVSGSNLVISAH